MHFDSKDFYFQEGDEPVAIIEVGVNHNGDMDLARKMIDQIASYGSHIIKFQAFIAEDEISRYAEKASYQKQTTGNNTGQLEMAKELELTNAQLREIRAYCKRISLPFLCTAFESKSLEFLVSDLGVQSVKIASSEITNHPFLAEIARTGAGIIISSGASTLEETAGALRVLQEAGGKEIVLLHCVSEYPARMDELNLRAMDTMHRAFGLPVGYSDHSIGINAPIAACALGACAVEKHFTLDRNMKGPDHKASIEPDELKAMLQGMRDAHQALGNGIKKPVSCEIPQIPLIRKSIVANTYIATGEALTLEKLTFKRPLNGIEPFDLEKILGKKCKQNLKPDQPITWDIIC